MPLLTSWCVNIDTTIDPIDLMWFLTFFPSHHCPWLSNREVDINNPSRSPTGRRWRSGNDGQGRRRNGRDVRSRRRTQNQGRGGAGMAMGSLVLGVVGRNSLVERGGGRLRSRWWRRRRRGQRHGREARGSCQRAAERDERGSRQCQQEGRTIPCKTLGEFRLWGNAGAMMMLAFEIFLFVKNII